MDISYLLNSNHVVKTVKSDRFYYDLYEYSLSVTVYGASCLRGISSEDSMNQTEFENSIKRRFEFRNMYRRQNNYGGNWSNPAQSDANTELRLKNLITLSRVLLVHINNVKIVVSSDSAYVYTNSVAALQDILALGFVSWPVLSRVTLDRARDTVRLNHSKHKIRSYFRNRRLNWEEKASLASWLRNQKSIRLSPSLSSWARDDNDDGYMHDYFFIDHNDARDLLMMDLIYPNLIRKVKPIVKA